MAHKILFIAPLPPPVHGSAMVSQYIKESRVVNEAFDCDFVNLSTSRSMEEIGKGGIKKLFRFVAAYFEVLWKLITHRYSLCYLAITCHGMGFLKDAPFVLLCKLFGRKVVLHQHNKGMSRDVERWPYRWLMPLVYRNTTVMLLSWHLYEDISAVVKREQVVVCANGVPPLDNGQQSTDNGLLRDETISHTEEIVNGQQTTDNSQLSTDGLFNQRDEHANIDTFTHTQACAGHPDEGFGLTQKSQKAQNLHDAAPVPSGVIACSDHELHGLHEYSGASATISHTEEIVNGQQTTVNGQRTDHPDGIIQHSTFNGNNLTQKARKAQNLHDAAPVRLPDVINDDDNQNENLSQSDFHRSGASLTAATQLSPLQSNFNRTECFHRSEASLTCTAGAPRLLFLSNLIESKGIYVLLEACRMLKEEGVAFRCDYVGGESKLISGEAFRSAIAERGLTDCVTYHGPQYGAAKERFFREADIFVFPTFYDNECFPLVLVEAMQHRLPVISTMEGGIPDIVTDGVNGFVCPQRDVQALAEALRKLIAEPQMRVAMGQRGYELYRERMTLEVFEKRFETLLREVSQC